MKPAASTLCAWLLVLTTAGCWVRLAGPQPVGVGLGAPDRPALALRVDELDLEWGDGRLADTLREHLASSGRFRAVHYPVVPNEPSLVRVDVRVTGSIDEHETWNFTAGFVSGYFLALPTLVLPLARDFELSATGAVTRDGALVAPVAVQAEASAVYGFWASPRVVEGRARDLLYAHLAGELLATIVEAAGP